jgi:Flp pilus assembly pilin Flp
LAHGLEGQGSMIHRLHTFLRDDSGQDLVEYGLVMLLIAIVAVSGLEVVGTTIDSVFWDYIATTFGSL